MLADRLQEWLVMAPMADPTIHQATIYSSGEPFSSGVMEVITLHVD